MTRRNDDQGLAATGGAAPRTGDNYRDPVGPKAEARGTARRRRLAWAGDGFRQPKLLVGVETAAIVLLAAVVSGSMDGSNTTLVIMGFDPDRAQLITSLIIGAVVAAAVAFATGRFGLATGLGFAGAAALFGGTFVAETGGALGARGVDGAFDLGGWLLTLAALLVSGCVAAWASAALASTARPSILRALAVLGEATSQRRVERGKLRYPAGVAAILAVLLVTVPVFGDLVNFAPDSLMRRGAAPQVVAAATATPTDPPASPSATPAESPSATDPASPSPSPTANPQPWLDWKPTGAGQVTTTTMPAPWKGGSANAVNLTIYTPPAYDSGGSPSRYPVLYEAPTGYRLWDDATNVKTALDTLIDSGAMPATIVVFIDSLGGPFPDTECANSYDHREWYDTFVSQTVVGWVDGHYRTIATQSARAVAGMSEGGYCAAILALHHPDVFGTSISFSGYYQAGAVGSVSAAPFGGNKALLAADSPTVVAPQLTAATRAQLYFIIIAKPDQPTYGPDAAAFEKILKANGYPFLGVASTEPHGWPQVRAYFPGAVEAWATHEVATGAFGG